MLTYRGSNCLRQRLVLSTLSGRPIRITGIREDSSSPGIQQHEATLLRLLDKITDGATIKIDETGTELEYHPGTIMGSTPPGERILHDCGSNRCVTYFLEVLLLLAPFAKNPLDITLKGLTHTNKDISVDTFKAITIPLLKKLLGTVRQSEKDSTLNGAAEAKQTDSTTLSKNAFTVCHLNDLEFTIVKRWKDAQDRGEVRLHCPTLRCVEPLEFMVEGKVKRVRGVAFSSNVSKDFTAQIVDRVRNLLNKFLPDVWIYVDSDKKIKAANSISYGISLVAETLKGFCKGADLCLSLSDLENSTDRDSKMHSNEGSFLFLENKRPMDSIIPTDDQNPLDDSPAAANSTLSQSQWMGKLAATRLLLEVRQGGITDTTHQYLPIYFMALANEYKASKVKLSPLTPYSIQFIRHIRDFLGITFELIEDPVESSVTLKCVGIGIKNMARKTF